MYCIPRIGIRRGKIRVSNFVVIRNEELHNQSGTDMSDLSRM